MTYQSKIKTASWILFLAYLAIIIPWSAIEKKMEANNAENARIIANKAEIMKNAADLTARATANNENKIFSVGNFVKDIHDIVEMKSNLQVLSDNGHVSKFLLADIKALHTNVGNRLTKHIQSLQDKLKPFAHLKLFEKINKERIALYGEPKGIINIAAVLKTLFLLGLIFVPFVFLILCSRIYFNPKFSLKEEIILGYRRLIFGSIFWPYGLADYPGNYTAISERIRKTFNKLFPGKYDRDCTKEDWEKVKALAYAPVVEFDQFVEAASELPEKAIEKSRQAITITSLFSTLFSPVICKAADFLQVFLTGNNQGNPMILKYNHLKESWQANLIWQDNGSSLTFVGGPILKVGEIVFKPELGFLATTKNNFAVETPILSSNIVSMPNARKHWGFWLLNKFFVNMKDRMKDILTWDFTLHSMLGKSTLGLGIGSTGTYCPFANQNRLVGTLDARFLYRLTDKVLLEIAMMFNFMDRLKPQAIRFLAFIPL